MVKRKSYQVRVGNELNTLINAVRIEYLKKNKKPPSTAKITDMICKKYNITKEAILYDQSIKL